MIMTTATTESEDLPAAAAAVATNNDAAAGEREEENLSTNGLNDNGNTISNNEQENDNPDDEEEDDDNIEDVQCYICWDDNATDENDNPIRRDCGCKGTAGWAHVNCLVEAIQSRNSLLDNWNRPWSRCQQCMLFYDEPTSSMLKERLLQDRPPVWTRMWNYIVGASNVIVFFGLFLLIACLCQKVFARLFAYGIVQIHLVLLPMLAKIWDETPFHDQIIVGCFTGAALLKVLHDDERRYYIGRSLFQFVRYWAMMMALHVANHLDKYSIMEQRAYFTAPFIMMGIKFYLNREQMQREFRQDRIDFQNWRRRIMIDFQNFRQRMIDDGPGAGPGGDGGIVDMLDLDSLATICEAMLLVAGWFIFVVILTRIGRAFATNFFFSFYEELSLLIVDHPASPSSLSTSIVYRVMDDAVINNMSKPNEIMSQLLFVKDSTTDSIVWNTQVLERLRDFLNTELGIQANTEDTKSYHLIHDVLSTFDRGGGEGEKLRTAIADVAKLRPFRDDYWYCCA